MTYPEFKEIMLRGIDPKSEFYKSLSGIIDCCEGLKMTVEEAAEKIGKILTSQK